MRLLRRMGRTAGPEFFCGRCKEVMGLMAEMGETNPRPCRFSDYRDGDLTLPKWEGVPANYDE